MAFFDSLIPKKKSKDGASDGGGVDPTFANGVFGRDLRKARKFFDYGETMAQARSYDQAIDCYISGLRFDPDNLKRYQELREIALKRKAGGGKGPGLMGVSKVGDTLIDKMLTAQKEWSLDPTNPRPLIAALQVGLTAQLKADELPITTGNEDSMTSHPLMLQEVTSWQADQSMDVMGAAAKPDKKLYLEMVECFRKMNRLDKALEAANRALKLDIENSELVMLSKNLAAEEYSRKNTNTQKGGFRENLNDAQGQKMIQAEITSAGVGIDDLIAKRRKEWAADVNNPDLIKKLVDTLVKKEDSASEKEAITLLKKAFELTKEYGHQVRAADIQMQLYNRRADKLRKEMQTQGTPEAKEEYTAFRNKQLRFELDHYAERCKEYPTDMKARFELGKRQYKGKLFDDAITSFQGAKNDPKSRAEASFFLGQCYSQKGWFNECIESLEQAMGEHKFEDDALGKEIRYELMRNLARAAQAEKSLELAEKAQKMASTILQLDINYKDIKEKLETIRGLVKKLKGQE